ncbi:uncharacterized protein LOC133804657 [Humulus lupulus]|uniref:uncharacterized protein LOC133804657 n=1 Tax=Humulus lupulus TaxID=3486 RepID=UPI002B40D366|nr:uncharacterized protein LOC133804657 [Humulus lupulus]
MVLPDPLFAAEWKDDDTAIRHIPKAGLEKLNLGCCLEEVESDLLADVVVDPPGQMNQDDYFLQLVCKMGDFLAQVDDEEVHSSNGNEENSGQDDDETEVFVMNIPYDFEGMEYDGEAYMDYSEEDSMDYSEEEIIETNDDEP